MSEQNYFSWVSKWAGDLGFNVYRSPFHDTIIFYKPGEEWTLEVRQEELQAQPLKTVYKLQRVVEQNK